MKILVVMSCMWLVVLCACAGPVTDGKQNFLDEKTQAEENNSQLDEELYGNTEASSSDAEREDAKDNDQMEGKIQKNASLEEELSRYRQEREDCIDEINYGSPDGDYTFTADLDRIMVGVVQQFDTKELGEAYEAARVYVEDALEVQPSTKRTVYMCVDPRMAAIYEDDDKGVAAGYENDHIFIYEYCGEDGIWQYLILVRDEKGAPWKVIHNGKGYKE